jgi:hypothetical protein
MNILKNLRQPPGLESILKSLQYETVTLTTVLGHGAISFKISKAGNYINENRINYGCFHRVFANFCKTNSEKKNN